MMPTEQLVLERLRVLLRCWRVAEVAARPVLQVRRVANEVPQRVAAASSGQRGGFRRYRVEETGEENGVLVAIPAPAEGRDRFVEELTRDLDGLGHALVLQVGPAKTTGRVPAWVAEQPSGEDRVFVFVLADEPDYGERLRLHAVATSPPAWWLDELFVRAA